MPRETVHKIKKDGVWKLPREVGETPEGGRKKPSKLDVSSLPSPKDLEKRNGTG